MSLLGLHGFACAAHLAQFAAITTLVARDPGQKWPLVQQGFLTEIHTWYYRLAYLVPVFPALSAMNHLVACVAQRWYQSHVLDEEVNALRWGEYAVSAGVMLWIVATLCGILELRTLISLAMMNALLQYVGYMIEKRKHEGGEVNSLLGVGFAIHLTIWVQLYISFYSVISQSDNVPPAVYSVVIIMFLLFSSFGIVSALWAKGVIRDFVVVEKAYISLSLVSKSFLTWIVYFGVLKADIPFNEQPP